MDNMDTMQVITLLTKLPIPISQCSFIVENVAYINSEWSLWTCRVLAYMYVHVEPIGTSKHVLCDQILFCDVFTLPVLVVWRT